MQRIHIYIMTASLLIFQSCSENNFIIKDSLSITAHRGGADLGNENTLSCINLGILSGADVIEIDIHQTKDGRLVVCHDETINRTTNKKGKIEDLTFDEIRQARIVSKDKEITEECIPTLEEVLALIKGRCQLLVEIKLNHEGQYPGIVQKTLDTVNAYGMHDEVIIQSFNDAVLEEMHERDSTIRLEKLIFCRLPFGLCFDNKFTSFSFEKYHYVASINTCASLTSKKFVTKAHHAGKEVRIWTVNKYSKLIPLVDGIITNDPALFVGKKSRMEKK